MIKLSTFPFKTMKTAPKVSDNRSTSLLLQGGYIRQVMSGAYEFLPMGYRVLKNIEKVIREEMDSAGYHEMLMTILTPKEIWEKTGRWEIEDYFKVPWHNGAEYRISPTNEENVTQIMSEFIQSYKDLPTCVYQIQKKFRNEKRAKSGLLRGREFTMKDAYSFHKDIKDFEKFYEWAKKVYTRIFERLGLGKDTFIANADWWAISDKDSHEFQVKLDIWEDIIYQCNNCNKCLNDELVDKDLGFKCIECNSKEFTTFKASEIWNIFHLWEKYTKAFWVKYLDENNKNVDRVEMWCYGIWVSRAMWIMAEYFMTDKWIAWPENIAPATYYIIVIWEENIEKATQIAIELEKKWETVILDDRMWRKAGFWQKAGDCELYWIPNRIVISPKTLEKGGYELKKRGEEEVIVEL